MILLSKSTIMGHVGLPLAILITSTSWNTGQNTFHGTVIVNNQRAEDREPVNQPLVIPEKLLSPAPLEFEVKHMEEQIIRNKPVRFAVYHPGKQNSMISKDFTHTWALANYFATDDNRGEIPNNPHMESNMIVKSSKVNLTVKTPEIPTTLFFQCKHESLMVGS